MKVCEGALTPPTPVEALPRCLLWLLAVRTGNSRPSAPAHATASSRAPAVAPARDVVAKVSQRVRGDVLLPVWPDISPIKVALMQCPRRRRRDCRGRRSHGSLTDGQCFSASSPSEAVLPSPLRQCRTLPAAPGWAVYPVSSVPITACRPIRRQEKRTRLHIAGGSVLAVNWRCQAVLNLGLYDITSIEGHSFCDSRGKDSKSTVYLTTYLLF